MNIHPQVCQHITIGKDKNTDIENTYKIMIDNVSQNMNKVKTVKYIGVTIDENLSFEQNKINTSNKQDNFRHITKHQKCKIRGHFDYILHLFGLHIGKK